MGGAKLSTVKEVGTARAGPWGCQSLVSGPQQSWVLPPDRRSAHRARELVEAACHGLSEELVDTARLLVTELVANAVVHGTGEVLLTVARRRRSLRVEVSDGSTRMPVVARGGGLRESGAGLRLVDALASRWGTGARTDGRPGKRVWFTVS